MRRGSSRRTTSRKSKVVIALAGTLIVLGAAIAGVARGGEQPLQQSRVDGTQWPLNAQGQTYGTMNDAASMSDLPDLLGAVATNGEAGFVLRSDLMKPRPRTADELAVYNDAYMKGWLIPVYKSDGVTQVGVYQVGGPGTESSITSRNGTTTTRVANPDGTISETSTSSEAGVGEGDAEK